MHNLLDSRPDGFESKEEAIRWQCVAFVSLATHQALMAFIPPQRINKYNSQPSVSQDFRSSNTPSFRHSMEMEDTFTFNSPILV